MRANPAGLCRRSARGSSSSKADKTSGETVSVRWGTPRFPHPHWSEGRNDVTLDQPEGPNQGTSRSARPRCSRRFTAAGNLCFHRNDAGPVGSFVSLRREIKSLSVANDVTGKGSAMPISAASQLIQLRLFFFIFVDSFQTFIFVSIVFFSILPHLDWGGT